MNPSFIPVSSSFCTFVNQSALKLYRVSVNLEYFLGTQPFEPNAYGRDGSGAKCPPLRQRLARLLIDHLQFVLIIWGSLSSTRT